MRRKEKMKKEKSSSMRRKQFPSTLETRVGELECYLFSRAAANLSESNDDSIWSMMEQKIDFLKKLLLAEFASDPEQTKHLRHISQRIHTLEEAFHQVLFVLEKKEMSHGSDTAASSSTLMFQGNLDTLSVCSCSNYDDGDAVVDDKDIVKLQDVDHESVLLLQYLGHNDERPEPEDSYRQEKEEEEGSCYEETTVVGPNKFNTVLEMEEEEQEGTKRSVYKYWFLVVMIVSYYYYYHLEESRVFLLTPT